MSELQTPKMTVLYPTCLENAIPLGVTGGAWQGPSSHSWGVWFQLPKSVSAHDLHQPQLGKAPGHRHGHTVQLQPRHRRRYRLLLAPERNLWHRSVHKEKRPCVPGQLAGAGRVRSRIGAGGSWEFSQLPSQLCKKNPKTKPMQLAAVSLPRTASPGTQMCPEEREESPVGL